MPTLEDIRDAINCDGRSYRQIAIAAEIEYKQLLTFAKQGTKIPGGEKMIRLLNVLGWKITKKTIS